MKVKLYIKNTVKMFFLAIFLFCTNLVIASNTTFADDNISSGTLVNDVHAEYSMQKTSPQKLKEIEEIASSDSTVNVTIKNNIISVDFYMPVSNIDTQSINKNEPFKVLRVIDFNTLMASMDDINETTLLRAARYKGQSRNGEYVPAGTPVHCNRFNGPHSNHRYYSRSSGDIQEATNWYKSDCFDKMHDYGCPLTKPDTKCDGLLKHGAHNCSKLGGWSVRCWYRN